MNAQLLNRLERTWKAGVVFAVERNNVESLGNAKLPLHHGESAGRASQARPQNGLFRAPRSVRSTVLSSSV